MVYHDIDDVLTEALNKLGYSYSWKPGEPVTKTEDATLARVFAQLDEGPLDEQGMNDDVDEDDTTEEAP